MKSHQFIDIHPNSDYPITEATSLEREITEAINVKKAIKHGNERIAHKWLERLKTADSATKLLMTQAWKATG